MFHDAADDEGANLAASYVGRVSVGGSVRSEMAVLLVTKLGLALHRPGRFEKYRAIPYDEIEFFDLRRRWNGMVLSIETNGEELRFRFFRPRGDLAVLVVNLNQRPQSSKPLRPRYALTQLSSEDSEDTLRQKTNIALRQSAFGEPKASAHSGAETTTQPTRLSHDGRDGSERGPVRRRANSGGRVFGGDRPNLAPLARALPKVLILSLALYSAVASGLWQQGLDRIVAWLAVPEHEEATIRPEPVEEPASSDAPVRPAPAEENLAHVQIDLSEIPNLAEILAVQRSTMNMSSANVAEEARIDPAVAVKIEDASDIVQLTDFLKYARVIRLECKTTTKHHGNRLV